MSRSPVIVVKLGGSLIADPALSHWLEAVCSIKATDRRIRFVVVPGGGPFADAVRKTQSELGYDDRTAHAMSVLAMDQFGILLCGLRSDLRGCALFDQFDDAWDARRVPVWLPSRLLIGQTSLEASWRVTSDTIAAWLANTLGADGLILVKSCVLPQQCNDPATLTSAGVVDAAFQEFLQRHPTPMDTLDKKQWFNLIEAASGLSGSVQRIRPADRRK
jgi:5-(aminomethyl)-3-furanmethanol phosphate kinase